MALDLCHLIEACGASPKASELHRAINELMS